ncbi:MAG: hypothetical protein MUE85_01015 [Microscillaceae bacterium]|jgi:hypothetical protein|nr:hypothetical protein [Microscillaceae bacterium]
MTHDFYNENLDAYLKSELTAQEKAVFEQLIEQDPVLKSDFLLQKDIYEAICQRRKQILKARLDKVEMDEIPFYYNLPRTAMVGTLATAVLLTGVLVFFDNVKSPLQKNEHLAKAPETQKNSDTTNNIQQIEAKDPQIAEAQSPTLLNETSTIAQPNYTIARVQNRNRLVINRLQVISPKNEAPLATIDKIDTRQEFDKRADESGKPRLVVEKKQNVPLAFESKNTNDDLSVYDGKNEPVLEKVSEKNKLTYQYYNNTLFLFNNNTRGKEFHLNINNKMRHFLLYENEYYEFNENQFNKSDLSKVEDSYLLQQLKNISQNSNSILKK